MTGSEGLLRVRAVADDTFTAKDGSYLGVVRVHGELWKAASHAPLAAGQEATVERQEGLALYVRPVVDDDSDPRESPIGAKP